MSSAEITGLLAKLREGTPEARETLVPLVYGELRQIARHILRSGRPGSSLNTTVLVNEAYLKLFDRENLSWEDRRHFFAVAARAMRQIVVDHARRRNAAKRGGEYTHVDLGEVRGPADAKRTQVLAIDRALEQLAVLDERLVQVVELRLFTGFSVEETAQILNVAESTVKRDWRKARALLYRELQVRESG